MAPNNSTNRSKFKIRQPTGAFVFFQKGMFTGEQKQRLICQTFSLNDHVLVLYNRSRYDYVYVMVMLYYDKGHRC